MMEGAFPAPPLSLFIIKPGPAAAAAAVVVTQMSLLRRTLQPVPAIGDVRLVGVRSTGVVSRGCYRSEQ